MFHHSSGPVPKKTNAPKKALQRGQTDAKLLRYATAQGVSICFAWRVTDKVRSLDASLFHIGILRVSSTGWGIPALSLLEVNENPRGPSSCPSHVSFELTCYYKMLQVETSDFCPKFFIRVTLSTYIRRRCVRNISFNAKLCFRFSMLTWITNSTFGPDEYT